MLQWLKDILGDSYTEDIDKKVSAEIGKDFVARADFNAKNEEIKTLNKTVKDRDSQLEELKKEDPAALQAKIAELQAANTTAQAEAEKQINAVKLDYALESRLIKEGAVNTKAVRALLDSTKISLDGDNVVGLDDQLKTLKESEKWAFGSTPSAGKTGLPQGGGGGERTLADDIKAQLYGESKTQ